MLKHQIKGDENPPLQKYNNFITQNNFQLLSYTCTIFGSKSPKTKQRHRKLEKRHRYSENLSSAHSLMSLEAFDYFQVFPYTCQFTPNL